MRQNLYSPGQKTMTKEGKDNWDRMFWNKCDDGLKKIAHGIADAINTLTAENIGEDD